MLKEHWEELKAQVEEHGVESVVFMLGVYPKTEHEDEIELDLGDVSYSYVGDDQFVVVKLS